MSEKSKIDEGLAAFEAAYAEAVDSGWTSTKALAQTIWQKTRSLPTAGSAGEEVEVVGYRIYWPAVGMEPAKARTVDPSEYDRKKPVFYTCVEPLMTVAQCMRMLDQQRAAFSALSAQQSAPDAPERVGVPVELAERIATHLEWDGNESQTVVQYANKCDALAGELRAILASHGRGEA